MKTIISFLILFSLVTLPAFGELTPQDIEHIRLIIIDSEKRINLIINDSEKRINQIIIDAEKRIKAEVKEDIATAKNELKEYVDIRIDSVEKRMLTYNWVIYVVMPLIVVAIGVPTAIMTWRTGKDRSLERQVAKLTEEIEILKQQKIVGA